MVACLLAWQAVQAQPERVGQAGALELMINSMPRSSGFNGINLGSSAGIESAQVNPGGVGTTRGTELLFSHTAWLMGSDIQINTFGFSQRLGLSDGVLGVSVAAFSLGQFVRTTVDQPDGSLGTFSPTMLNVGLTYARQFTDHIYVGLTARVVHNSTPEVQANGVSFDAGIQYRSGEKDRIKLGIALRNTGPPMRFAGDGLAGRVKIQPNNPFTTTTNLPTAKFELPTVLSMGGSYDFFLGNSNTITILVAFISNSFYYNQGGIGLAYKYKEYVIFRGSFLYEKGIFGSIFDTRYTAFTGPSMGATFQIPFKTGKLNVEGIPVMSTFSFDASYRFTNPFGGTLVLGARIDI
ncbi:MAG: hypothetical protein D6730_07120 [Bacteroidetes bacterium]|nr:MAG: hypothetical protein D6730_07120 [Bacteroidota bacterium]